MFAVHISLSPSFLSSPLLVSFQTQKLTIVLSDRDYISGGKFSPLPSLCPPLLPAAFFRQRLLHTL